MGQPLRQRVSQRARGARDRDRDGAGIDTRHEPSKEPSKQASEEAPPFSIPRYKDTPELVAHACGRHSRPNPSTGLCTLKLLVYESLCY